MCVISVMGARPQFVKAAIVTRALAAAGIEEKLVHTGQHYDEAMSGRLLRQLGIEDVAVNLAVGSGSHARQTADIMVGFGAYLDALAAPAGAVLVYGDTNSTIATALVATKRHIPVVHVEAGLRSFNRAMPEEVNRVVVDHVSDLLLCTSDSAAEQLRREGVEARTVVTGDVMLDAFEIFGAQAEATADLRPVPLDLAAPFALVTIHRPANADHPARLQAIVVALSHLDMPCLWPVHPRIASRVADLPMGDGVKLAEPLGYFEMLAALKRCAVVVTDSGGVQKEAYWAGKPCVTLRGETEWVETLEGGWNRLVDVDRDDIGAAVRAACAEALPPQQALYGDGQAGRRIAEAVAALIGRA